VTTVSDERLNRALIAFLRQEVQAPADAITNFLDIVIEDARRLKLDHLLSDIDRMRAASLRLKTFIDGLVLGPLPATETIEMFQGRLRHDLRNPLNAIKGYSELLSEDMKEQTDHPLRRDLVKVKDSADQLLSQINTMFKLTGHEQQAAAQDDDRSPEFNLLANVLSSEQACAVMGSAGEAVAPSNILVIEDNTANRDVLERRLMRQGHRVVTAADGAAALSLVGQQEFDLVLLDLIMPEMNGFEVLRRLKAAEHTSHLPVIVISALDELDSVVRCIENGAEDYLIKPFDPVLLRARIDASLERKRLRDQERKFIVDLEQERRRSESLLLNILPEKIVKRLRGGESVIADRIEEATILFCDLVGFTALSQELPADLTVELLRKIFSTFDCLAAEHGVEKVKTIGDSYMAAAGIPERRHDDAIRIAMLAPRMLAAVQAIAKTDELTLQARIGIHTGPVLAGVIGTHKFVYDIWGDTVNTASRMESYSLPGRIQVSSATRIALGDRFNFESRGTIDIKGKGMMETYFLNGSRSG